MLRKGIHVYDLFADYDYSWDLKFVHKINHLDTPMVKHYEQN